MSWIKAMLSDLMDPPPWIYYEDPFCSAYSPSPTLLSSCKPNKIDTENREKKNEGMREELWESERQ